MKSAYTVSRFVVSRAQLVGADPGSAEVDGGGQRGAASDERAHEG